MGRRKISIAPIQDDRNRAVTFVKRKNGLFKKAHELGILCQANVAVIVFNSTGKLFEFSSADMDGILFRYSEYSGANHEKRGPLDYISQESAEVVKKGLGGKMTTLSDRGDEEDDEDGGSCADHERAEASSHVERRTSLRSARGTSNQPPVGQYSYDSPPPPNSSHGHLSGPPGASTSNLGPHPSGPYQMGYPSPHPYTNTSYLTGGYPTQMYSNGMQQQQWSYPQTVIPPISQNGTRAPHPLAGIPPQPTQGAWYPPQQAAWGYGGGPSSYGQPAPFGGPGGMSVAAEMAAMQHVYAGGANGGAQQQTARPEGCFSQETGHYPAPYAAGLLPPSSRAGSGGMDQDGRPLPPSRSSTNSSHHSTTTEQAPHITRSDSTISRDGKPRLSVSIPSEERGHGMVLREGRDGKVFTEEAGASSDRVEQTDEEEGGLRTAVSHFASDLLPSPSGFLNDICYSGYSLSGLNTAIAMTNSTSQQSQPQQPPQDPVSPGGTPLAQDSTARSSVFSWPQGSVTTGTAREGGATEVISRSDSSRGASHSPRASAGQDSSRSNSPPSTRDRPFTTGGFRPAPMLGEEEAPDVIRNLKRGSLEGISPATALFGDQERRIKHEAGVMEVDEAGGEGDGQQNKEEFVKKTRQRVL